MPHPPSRPRRTPASHGLRSGVGVVVLGILAAVPNGARAGGPSDASPVPIERMRPAVPGPVRPAPRAAAPRPAAEDAFRYVVESIRLVGNRKTSRWLILRRIGIRVGDAITSTDERVERARIELLATGLFRDVSFALRRGSRRGRVVLEVKVVERGTFVVQGLHLGYTDATPFWGGFDLAENNFLGRGLHLSGAFVGGAAARDNPASRVQHAERLRFSWPELIARKVGIGAELLYHEASDLFRLQGANQDGSDVENFTPVRYRRAGGILGTSIPLGIRNYVYASYRLEWIRAFLPLGAVRTFPDGREQRIDFDLQRDQSFLSTVGAVFVRDTRNDPILPTAGMRLEVAGDLGLTWIGSDYQYFKVTVSFRKYWKLPWRRHVVSLGLFGGIIIGEAPLFEQFFIGDLTELLPKRVLQLNFSTRPSRNLLHNRIAEMRYEDFAGRAAVTYSIPLSRGGRGVYGSDFYVSAGIITLLSARDFRIRDVPLREAIPLDLTFDVGFRLDTHVGVFTLSLGNAFGWIPR